MKFRKVEMTAFKVLFLVCFLLGFQIQTQAAKQPNIVIIMADDLGYGDLGSYGHPSIRTPHLDRMAAEGLRFTDFYSGSSICTPSRAALLTGRLPVRSGMAGGPGRHVLYPTSTGGLPTNEITIATALKSAGYKTACIGKWHLGHLPEFLPNNHGFDLFFGLPYSNDMDAVSAKARRDDSHGIHPKSENFNVALMRNDEVIERPAIQETLTKRYTEEAIRFIKENKKKPFFIYFPHTFPHVPLFASEQFKDKSARGRYGDTVEEIDWSVGQIIETLRKEKLEKNTLVIFTSDNGPWLIMDLNGGSGGMMRDGKAGTWEGGFRVPTLAFWPGKIKAGRVTSEVANAMDLFTTSLNLGGAKIPKDRVIDGVDMSPILFDKGHNNRTAQFYYYGDQLYAVRKGVFKAHFTTHDGYSKEPHLKQEPPLLFNLAEDPSEKVDVAKDHPDVIADLVHEAKKYRASVVPGKPQF